jgi:hypothetical protein
MLGSYIRYVLKIIISGNDFLNTYKKKKVCKQSV